MTECLFLFQKAFEMESLLKLAIFLSLCGSICANSKPVLARDSSTQQLFTSSLLTWESYNNDPNQLRHAVVGGAFIGEDVRIYSAINVPDSFAQLNFIAEL